MASKILIKRSSSSNAPLELAQGELAYSYGAGTTTNGGDKLYIGTGTETGGVALNVDVIGGKYFTEMLNHTHGTLTASSAIIVDANSKIDQFLVDNLKLDGNDITSTNANGNINITPDGTGRTVVKNLTADNFIISSLDANRIVLTSTGGALVEDDDFNYTKVGSLFTLNLTGDLNVTGSADIDNISIDGNTITTTNTNGVLEIAANGSGYINFSGTKAIKLPVGSEADKAGFTSVQGHVRYNTTSQQFEGYNGSNWSGLGGVIDVDQDTKILAELSSGSDNDKLYFYTAGTLRTIIDQNGIEVLGQDAHVDVGNIRLVGNKIITTDGTAGAPSTLYIDPSPLGTTGTVVIEGNLQVNGVTTTVNSNVTTVNDPIFEIGDPVVVKTVEVEQTASTTLSANAAVTDTTLTVTSATGIENGDRVLGAGIDVNTFVTNVAGTTITISQQVATAMASGAAVSFVDEVLEAGATVLTLSEVDNIAVGDAVSGTGIAGGTTVTNISGNDITLSAATTANIADNQSITITKATDDNRDRGIKFSYNTGSAAKTGFFGWDDSEGEFTFIPDATDSSSVMSGTRGRAHFDDLKLDGEITLYSGLAIADGELLIGNGAGTFDKATLSRAADTPITITNGAGSITFDIDAAETIGTTDTNRGVQTDTDYDTLNLAASGTSSQNKAARGVASFASEQFTVTSGHVYISTIDGGTY
jgi:hypothetical protein